MNSWFIAILVITIGFWLWETIVDWLDSQPPVSLPPEVVAQESLFATGEEVARVLADVEETSVDHQGRPGLRGEEQACTGEDLRSFGRQVQPEEVSELSHAQECAISPHQEGAARVHDSLHRTL